MRLATTLLALVLLAAAALAPSAEAQSPMPDPASTNVWPALPAPSSVADAPTVATPAPTRVYSIRRFPGGGVLRTERPVGGTAGATMAYLPMDGARLDVTCVDHAVSRATLTLLALGDTPPAGDLDLFDGADVTATVRVGTGTPAPGVVRYDLAPDAALALVRALADVQVGTGVEFTNHLTADRPRRDAVARYVPVGMQPSTLDGVGDPRPTRLEHLVTAACTVLPGQRPVGR